MNGDKGRVSGTIAKLMNAQRLGFGELWKWVSGLGFCNIISKRENIRERSDLHWGNQGREKINEFGFTGDWLEVWLIEWSLVNKHISRKFTVGGYKNFGVGLYG